MLRLAVTTAAETFERMRAPLAERGVSVEHLPAKERVIDLTSPPARRFDVGFVYPTRTTEGDVVDRRHGIPWVNGREAVLTSRNKAGVLAALSRAGLPVPRTKLVSNPVNDDDVAAAAADLPFPLVIKPNSTTRGVGVAKAPDLDSLLGIVDYLNLVHDFRATGDRSYLLQEFLPDARDYRVMVVDGQVVGGVERRLSRASREAGRWKHNVHRGATAHAVDVPENLRSLAVEAAAELDIDYLGVDVLVGDDGTSGERAVVAETNARPTIDDEKYEEKFWDRLTSLIRRTADG